MNTLPKHWLDMKAHLQKCGSLRHGNLEKGINGNTDHGGQGHAEPDDQGPVWIHVIVVSNGFVLNHCEDQNKLNK